MKARTSAGARRASTGGTDGRSVEAALAASSLLLWVPYSVAAVYVAYCSAFVLEQPPSVTAQGSGSAAAAPAEPTFGAITGAAPTAAAAHRYSSLYYYVFPIGFDIAVFVPLLVRVLCFSAVAILLTYYLSVRKTNGGEYLMAVAWALGTFSGYGWLNSSTGSVLPTPPAATTGLTPTSWMWLVVSLFTGLFSGILCKVKDIVDGKHDRDTHLFPIFDRTEPVLDQGEEEPGSTHGAGAAGAAGAGVVGGGVRRYRRIRVPTSHHLVSLGDRLYMIVPFCTGQWFAFILHHGWRGIIIENGTILLSLSLVGYTMLSYKFLKRQVLRVSGRVTRSATERSRVRRAEQRLRQQQAAAAAGGAEDSTLGSHVPDDVEDVAEVAVVDVIDLISKLFTTSFGVVVLVVLGLNLFMTSLCIPFLKALFKLNALVSGVGIVIELIMYEVA